MPALSSRLKPPQLKESATGSSFSFQCAADAEGFSRSYLTKFVAAVLREALPPAQKKGDLLEKGKRHLEREADRSRCRVSCV